MTEEVKLPPLPAKGYGYDGHSDEAMIEFARSAALAERERCAKFVEHEYERQFTRPWREDLAAAIRGRGEERLD